MRGLFSEHVLKLDDWRCDCDFFMSMSLPCHHSIAYRKYMEVLGPVIPWNRIDERWNTLFQDLKKVKQLIHEKFVTWGGSQQNELKSQSERYRDAVRATHLIANELADIEDKDEFDDMLVFALAQWRSVRQKQMTSVSDKVAGDDSGCAKGIYARDPVDEALVKKQFNISSSDEDDGCSVSA